MKKLNTVLIMTLVLISIGLSGCFFFSRAVAVNKWKFVPQQATGSEMNLSFVTSSEMSFNFMVENTAEARTLKASTFSVICKTNSGDVEVTTLYFENMFNTEISFEEKQSQNIILHAKTGTSLDTCSEISIYYDGTLLCKYNIVNK